MSSDGLILPSTVGMLAGS
uniref:Uncharacterized protein n=1 Tax=Arundo donax TaxID=35708 RepID=A0A0A9HPX1_ARUDO